MRCMSKVHTVTACIPDRICLFSLHVVFLLFFILLYLRHRSPDISACQYDWGFTTDLQTCVRNRTKHY